MTTQQRPRLTDDAVRRLPLEGGKAALLEELVAEAPAARRTPRWVAPLAAAAVVAGVVGASTLWPSPARVDPLEQVVPATQGPSEAAPAPTPYVVLDAAGWTPTHLSEFDGITYEKGGAELEITTYPARLYDGYVEDREHISEPPAPGDPVEALGRSGQLWAYSADDHTVIVAPVDGRFSEVRAQGLDLPGYLTLLGQLRQVDAAGLDATLPPGFVRSDERARAASEIVAAIERVAGIGFPGPAPSFDEGPAADSYQFAVEVTGAYACAWLDRIGTSGSADAEQVLATAPQWPVLTRLDREGAWGEVLREYAAEAATGTRPEGYRGGLGC